jgi:CTP:molybdopterin cytidylyltransferase MocA
VTFCGVVLAGGEGRRFGGLKQLASLAGRPLLQHAVDAANAAPELDRVVVVLGARAAEVAAALSPGRAELVVCDDWAEGMAASLRAGADWSLVTMGDEPRLPPAAVARVVEAARAAPPGTAAVRARWHGTPGHPVALSARLAPRVEDLRGDVGARALFEHERVLDVELGDLGRPLDVDLAGDLPRA